MRGEDIREIGIWTSDHGSPPHARGRLMSPRLGASGSRLTPACAGKTFRFGGGLKAVEAHPRMRGEDDLNTENCGGISGSPPHARGRLGVSPSAASKRRLTPACAGKTPNVRRSVGIYRAHPRMRGEDNRSRAFDEAARGSPPHARGRPSSATACDRRDRLTPACAGKTLRRTTTLR